MRRGAKPTKAGVSGKPQKNQGPRVRDLEKRLAEARERERATGEILRVISNSPAALQPVFDAIVQSAQRLLRAHTSSVFRRLGDEIHLAAYTRIGEAADGAFASLFPMSFDDYRKRFPSAELDWVDGTVIQVPDLDRDIRSPANSHLARARGFRSLLQVPMRHAGHVIGLLRVTRAEASAFADDEITLLQTFADQAVIAIETVRLFNETKRALEQQTATSEILRVISSSPTDVQPVFETIVENAARICGATDATIRLLEHDTLRLVARFGSIPLGAPDVIPLSREYPSGRSVIECRTIHIEDILPLRETEFPPISTDQRTVLATPLMREALPIGAILIRRVEVQPFTDKQIALLKTFADQAIIAIENVRLFTELEARNRELTDALDRQTATSEILRVISSSPTDVQPVFDAIAQNAVTLCGGVRALVLRFDGVMLQIAGQHNMSPDGAELAEQAFPRRPGRDYPPGRAFLDRSVVHIPDLQAATEFSASTARREGVGSMLAVPLLREQDAVGVISLARDLVGPFSPQQIGVLQTFADQAVIAIENVRLFRELEARTHDLTRSVDELRALGEVGQAISSTLDLRTVLSTIVARATQLSGTDAGVIYEYDEQREVFVPRATEHLEADIVETMLATPVRKGEGATGRLAETQEPIQVPDILAAPAESRVRGALVRAGYRALLAVPLVREDHLIGGLTVIRKATGAFAPEAIELLQTFATQSSLAIQNARLFREIEEKSRQLEVASQHKSEFLANMSHELRTPLNAIIGFSEVLTDRMFGELNEKQEEYLKDIYASGTHLLSLINDILDLSKIEAGRMELELTDFDLPQAIDNALTLVRERAGRRNITLQMSVDERLGEVRADERKIRQVVLNLLSNAIKFTPEGGRIEVAAVPKDGFAQVSVSDTGVGIAPEHQDAVFEEFRQVGTAEKKAEGTGLGLTLCRKFIELHGGKIWVTSQVDVGSMFTFTIPARRGE